MENESEVVEIDFAHLKAGTQELAAKFSDAIKSSAENLDESRIKFLGASALATMAFKAAGHS